MTLKAYKLNAGDIKYDVFKCQGEGQCQCARCKDRGIYNVSWTSWFYKLNEDDKGVLCHDCIYEILIQRRIAEVSEKQKAEIERLTEWKDKLQDTKDELEQLLIDTGFKEYCEENKRLTDENAELQKQVEKYKDEAITFKLEYEHQKDLLESKEEDYIVLDTLNTELQKQVDELKFDKEILQKLIDKREKDTAKEIYGEIGDNDILVITTQEYGSIEVVPLERLQEIIKNEGVEVE